MIIEDTKIFVDILDWAAQIQTADHIEPSDNQALGYNSIQIDWTVSYIQQTVYYLYILAFLFYYIIQQYYIQFEFIVDIVNKVEKNQYYFAEILQRKQILIQYQIGRAHV